MSEPLKTSEIIPIAIEKEMKTSYLDYAMSVIVSRAIPDVRDGLKPVHRRILHAMNESGNHSGRAYRKSARIVGDVMGKYHPHGDAAIYDSMVRMAQDFSMSAPLIDGQGNFGSMDGDSAAAMRYTESRMAKIAHTLVDDIDKNTVDFQPNYDGSEQEPVVLPSQFPNILVNGAGGIAVGMATNIPPHNLGEVIDVSTALLENPELGIDELIPLMPGPDFPTGGIIMGRTGSVAALQTGRGSVVIRGKAAVEEIRSGKEAIIITEIPYQVNKALMVEKIAELVRDKKIEGISDLRDESDKSGVRVVVELKRDAVGDVVLNQLYKFTPLQTSFGVNMLALNRGRPLLMNVKQVVLSFLDFRKEVVTRRTQYLLDKARDRAHILIGLSIAVANIDEVIALIRASKDPVEAKAALMAKDWNAANIEALIRLVDDAGNVIKNGRCKFTDEQAKAILEMKLARLTGLEQSKIDEEMQLLAAEITEYLNILGDSNLLRNIIRKELLSIKEQFAVPRRTEIQESEFEEDMESLIQKEDMVVTVTMGGYIKRVPLSTYRAQRRGGKGRSGMAVKEEDVTTQVFIANTHTPMLFFSTHGKVYKLKVYRLPLGAPQSRGRSLVNIFPLAEGETINQVLALPEDENVWDNMHILFATKNGNIRRNLLSDFRIVQSNGKIAMKLDENDSIIGVMLAQEEQHILLATKAGKALRSPVTAVRVFKSRASDGVRGINLEKGDEVMSLSVLNASEGETDKREQYLKIPLELRSKIASLSDDSSLTELLPQNPTNLSSAAILKLAKEEEFILTLTENGFGKRSSAYEYRITNRGGKGITNIDTSERNGKVVASFPVKGSDQIMLITNKGTLIRCPVNDIRIAGRATQGVTIFRVGEGEKVVSAAQIAGGSDEETSDTEIVADEGSEE